jgi:hypothetical protein
MPTSGFDDAVEEVHSRAQEKIERLVLNLPLALLLGEIETFTSKITVP